MKNLTLFVSCLAIVLSACGDQTTVNNYYTTNVVPPSAVPDAGTSAVQQPDGRLADTGNDAVSAADVQPANALDAQAPEAAMSPDATSIATDTQTSESGHADALPTAVYDAQGVSDTQTSEAGTAPKGFKILAVAVLKQDSLGQSAEDVRAFAVGFSSSPSTAWVTVSETFLGTNIVWEPILIKGVTTSVLASPGMWAQKLKPDTSYTWTISAASIDGTLSDSMTGTFITSVCFPGQTKSCYGGPVVTRNVGRCHDGQQSCIAGSTGLVWDGNCIGEVTPYPFGDRCANGIDDDCNGKVDDSVKMNPVSVAETWSASKSSLDGELLRFDMDGTASGPTYLTWLNIPVELHGLYSGYYRLNVMNVNGQWVDLSPFLVYFDATGGGYKPGMQDLGKNLYTGSNANFVLGIQWKDSGGMTLGAGITTHFMLAGDLSQKEYGVGGTVVHSSPHSESSCDNAMGKTITVVP